MSDEQPINAAAPAPPAPPAPPTAPEAPAQTPTPAVAVDAQATGTVPHPDTEPESARSVPEQPAAPAAPVAPTPDVAPSIGTLGTMPAVAPQAAQPKQEALPADWPYKGFSGVQPYRAVNPPEITHSQRMVSSGTTGEEVVQLAALLARLGYPTALSEGQNPHAIYDEAMASQVRRFCEDFGVSEDPAIVQAMTPDTVGPWLWEALIRAAHKAAE